MNLQQNTYDQYADEYAAMLRQWADDGYSLYHSLVIPQVLEFLGDVAGRTILDAGCGEGHVARLLANRGAHVTAVDVSRSLVDLAKSQEAESQEFSGRVRYVVQDLSQGFENNGQLFDLVVSNLVLNDVYDYIGYINTLGAVTQPGGRVILSFNNPYSATVRAKAHSYFDSGTAMLYGGLSKLGVQVYHFHRTFEEYITAFRNAGFLLRSLSDLRGTDALREQIGIDERIMPFVIVLEFVKSKGDTISSEIPAG